MPLILLLLAVRFVAHFFWLLAALAAAAVTGRLIGAWPARRDDQLSRRGAGMRSYVRGLTCSIWRCWQVTIWWVCMATFRQRYEHDANERDDRVGKDS
jgi:hypothetical protein